MSTFCSYEDSIGVTQGGELAPTTMLRPILQTKGRTERTDLEMDVIVRHLEADTLPPQD